MNVPGSLHSLLRWYLRAWADEMPSGTSRSVRHSTLGDDGRPQWQAGFAERLTGSAYQTEPTWHDGRYLPTDHYVAPLRCALSYLAHHRHPLMARWLEMIGETGGDVATVAVNWTQHPGARPEPMALELAELLTQTALRECFLAYRAEPTARPTPIASRVEAIANAAP